MLEGMLGTHLVQPLLKQVHPQLAVQDHTQAGFEYLQRDSTTFLCNLFWCSDTLTENKFFPHIQMELLCSILC